MKAMEMVESIRFIERNVEIGNNDIIMDTEFGRLVIEVNYEDYGPEARVIVEDWSDAPDTRFNMMNLNCKADFYVCICNPSSGLTLHLRAIEAMYKVMFRSMLRVAISDDIADAAILIHRYEQEGKQLTLNMLVHDFSRHNLNMMVRGNDMVQYLVRDHFERRLSTAKQIIAESCEMFDNEALRGMYHCVSMDNYSRQIFGLMIYVSKAAGIDMRKRVMITTRAQRAYLNLK